MTRGLREMEDACRHVRDELCRERLGRTNLAALEAEMAAMAEDRELGLKDAQRRGETPDNMALAVAAMQAVNGSLEWARMFRRHATLNERREQLQMGLHGAVGVLGLLRRREKLQV